MYNDDFLLHKLNERKTRHAFRCLTLPTGKIDFCSNDYLGIATNNLLNYSNDDIASEYSHGSKGSRLLSGNYELVERVEKEIAAFHKVEAALIFNSGYDANVGVLSCIPQKGDTIIYDRLSHASIRDGIRLSFADAYSFAHNDLNDLEKRLKNAKGNTFVVTESVFSMDGDICPIEELVKLTEKYGAQLIIDEAHATGVVGEQGEGVVQAQGLEQRCFARIHTFGKGCGCHGAVVAGSRRLRDYLINFSRPFIYTTALPAASVHAISLSYKTFPKMNEERKKLNRLIDIFQTAETAYEKIVSKTPIQGVIVPGNERVKETAGILQDRNFDVRPILYPTVPKGKERLRIVLHSFNTEQEVEELVSLLK